MATPAQKPGHIISIDQLVSPTPGLIAQMTGFMTKQQYQYATVYVDQASGLGCVYLQKTASATKTLEGKLAFERYCLHQGVVVCGYHADNGIFKAHDWVQACYQHDQSLTFAAFGAHHTNGKAERHIHELQEMACTMLVHANRHWPTAIDAYLWPYAVHYANKCINNMPNMQDPRRHSPLQIFAGSLVNINPKHWKPFGCPVYVLDELLQAGKKINKWKTCTDVGIYLGLSPLHSHNVALVLNCKAGYVSPQFHIKFDKGFYTNQQESLHLTWQRKTYFIDDSNTDSNHSSDSKLKPTARHASSALMPQST
jgi:hypothetical protein